MEAHQASLSLTVSWSFLRFMPVESAILFNHITLCHSLLLLPSIFLSIRAFPVNRLFTSGDKNIGASASTSVPPNEYSGLISFRLYWFDLVVQGTLKSLLQHYNSKSSILGLQPFLWTNSHIHTWLLEKYFTYITGFYISLYTSFLFCQFYMV